MLTGKKFPQNVWALRMVAEEMLRKTLIGESIRNTSDLMEVLEKHAKVNRTAKLWLDNVIKPVFIMMMFI